MKKSFENLGAYSSDVMMPFFDVCADDQGAMIAIGWTGSWKADFTECDEGVLVTTGLSKTHFFLKKGEKIRTSSTLIMNYEKGEDRFNKFRKLLYKIRSAYSASFGGAFYNAYFQEMTDSELDSVSEILEEYKSIRKYFSKNFYNLGSDKLDMTSWTVWRFHDDEKDEGIVMAFRRENSPFDKFIVEFDKEYSIKNLDTGISKNTSKLDVVLNEKRSSVIFAYKK